MTKPIRRIPTPLSVALVEDENAMAASDVLLRVPEHARGEIDSALSYALELKAFQKPSSPTTAFCLCRVNEPRPLKQAGSDP